MAVGHLIKSVEDGSIAWEMELEPGDRLLRINGKKILDVFDYHYYIKDTYLELLVLKPNGEEWELEIDKEYDEDLGIDFEDGLMDDYKSCHNKCIFCFIDQMPPGMRETLYFKDDDARLSFLQGNYITLTNMKQEDLDRIIKYRLAPVNISVHTMNPELRCKMLNNRFAGEALDKIRQLYDAKLTMNSQIVLCKGYNDGEELDRSIRELMEMYPYMESLSVVPVGLSKYREGLAKLEKFSKEDAKKVLSQIHAWQEKSLSENKSRFVFASDEWYLTAEEPIPKADYYEGYGQLENGVGMIRSLLDEVEEEVKRLEKMTITCNRKVTIATGVLIAPTMQSIAKQIESVVEGLTIQVIAIRNDFFGEDITVAGLVTATDIMAQLADVELGEKLLLPQVMLRNGERVFLDDYTVEQVETSLQIPVGIVQSNGKSLVEMITQK
ncbi:MAG: DUF512 domain-containing protein [Lachnospiraceae bacterium]|nr:DUF512 domain-containing protein [Lachnospiraceae bacterium]